CALPRPPRRAGASMDASDSVATAIADLEVLEAEGLTAFRQADSPAAVEAARIEYLGMKRGKIKSAQEWIKSLEPSAKRAYGQRFNAVKQVLEAAHEAAKARFPHIVSTSASFSTGASLTAQADVNSPVDVTLPGRRPRL